MAAIVAIHAAAFTALAHLRVQPSETPASEPVHVAFIADAAASPPPPALHARLQDVQPAVLLLPSIDIPVEAPPTPPPAAITVVAATAPAMGEAGSAEPVVVEAPDYVRQCTLRYPPLARRMNAHGTTHVIVLVDTQGRPQDVKVEHSSGFRMLDEAAVDCARQALFKPRREGGRLRNSQVRIPFDFVSSVRTASR